MGVSLAMSWFRRWPNRISSRVMVAASERVQPLMCASMGLLMNIDEKNPFRLTLLANDDA